MKGGFSLDLKTDGAGVVELGFHATAPYADPITDNLYLVLDEDTEPTSTELLQPSTAPTPDGFTIYQFDGDDASQMVQSWRGKLNLLPNPTTFVIAQVKADDYLNLVLKLYADGVLFFEQAIVSSEEFTVPMVDEYVTFEWEVVGTSRVRTLQIAEDVMELT